MGNIDKLPKWARDRIYVLERQVSELKDTLARRNGEAIDGRVILDPYHEESKLVFPTRTTVQFKVSDVGWRGYFEASIKGDSLQVRAAGPLIILPEVTNSISLRLAD